ncbi:pilus assembly protein PilX [Desulfuromonas soudanensis]|uniref:Pilus assembly protein PilX n=1 Tax=Desulfuromonas soudanensis TaxID=1603606 RepID=A0A0M4DIW8_9BACT|nr:PilX N-terminal domain-containing pilus assembly protein [Desulfuromonas soudanensis]ALC16932.1 pilus assembly protein PilX [Desulfuromonas soudanensis]
MKKSFARIKKEETGSVLILSLLILMVLTLLGISASNTSVFEYKIASNDKYRDMAFYNADGGIYATAKLIGEVITGSADPDHPGVVSYPIDGGFTVAGDFYKEAMGYKVPDDPSLSDLRINLAQGSVDIDIVSRSAQQIAGGGAEFGSGSGGAGVGSVGGIGIKYEIDAYGNGPANSRVVVGTRYVKILGASGGL